MGHMTSGLGRFPKTAKPFLLSLHPNPFFQGTDSAKVWDAPVEAEGLGSHRALWGHRPCSHRGTSALPSLCRPPSAHEYYDPNDYLGGAPQDLDREELELEVRAVTSGPRET